MSSGNLRCLPRVSEGRSWSAEIGIAESPATRRPLGVGALGVTATHDDRSARSAFTVELPLAIMQLGLHLTQFVAEQLRLLVAFPGSRATAPWVAATDWSSLSSSSSSSPSSARVSLGRNDR